MGKGDPLKSSVIVYVCYHVMVRHGHECGSLLQEYELVFNAMSLFSSFIMQEVVDENALIFEPGSS